MTAIFHVDQAATFRMVMFLSSAPKLVFGKDIQDTNSDGVPRWEVQIVASFEGFGGKVENEVLKVGMVDHRDPADALGGMPQPVQLVGFRVGVMPPKSVKDKDGRDKISGGTAFYQADGLQPLGVPATRAAGKADA
jgi:hypothetical protein